MANYVIQKIIECWNLFVYIFRALTAGDGKNTIKFSDYIDR